MLEVRDLQTAYGRSQVLVGVSLEIRPGQVVTLLGRNGMGRTTTVLSIMGIVRPQGGKILLKNKPLLGLPSYRIAQAGLGLVPEGRQGFPNLTVRENLLATAANRHGRKDPWTLERVYRFFGQLRERPNNYWHPFAGGEEQIVALGPAARAKPPGRRP